MEVRLIDSSLNDIKQKLELEARKLEKSKKKSRDKLRLWVIMNRGDISMKNGEWMNNESLANDMKNNKLTLSKDDINAVFSEKNLNKGLLGYGDPKDGLGGLLKWVKHNISPAKLKKENRDLNIKIESLKYGKNGKYAGVQLILRVPAKGASQSKDLKNYELEQLGYVGLSKWTKEQLEKLSESDKTLDKVIVAVLSKKSNLKEKVEEAIK